jgi:hypothetical protein
VLSIRVCYRPRSYDSGRTSGLPRSRSTHVIVQGMVCGHSQVAGTCCHNEQGGDDDSLFRKKSDFTMRWNIFISADNLYIPSVYKNAVSSARFIRYSSKTKTLQSSVG